MITSWMAYTALVTALLTLAATALERVAIARGWPRRLVWIGALAGSIAWPIGGAIRDLLPSREPLAPFTITLPTQVIVDRASSPDLAVILNRGLMALWIAGTVFLVLRLLRGVVSLRRTRRAWRRGEIDGTVVQLSDNVGPAVVGLRPMEVVLPEWITTLDAPLRALVLCHEEEHRRARDPYFLCAAAIAVALMPWNVALWIQARRLRLAMEMDCDARVLRAHPSPERYGMLMITIAQRRSVKPALFAPMLSEPTSNLERRILAMRPTRRLTRATVFGGSLLAISAIAFACTLQTEATTAPNATPVASKTAQSGPAYFEFQVEKAAAPVSGNPGPRYPDMLRAANVEGSVLAQFIVGTDGRADMGSFKVLKSTHDMLTASVRGALAQMQFTPAEVGGHQVKQLVQMPFDFSLSKDGGVTMGKLTTPGSEGPTKRATLRAPTGTPEGAAGPTSRRAAGKPQPVSENQTYFEFQVEKQVSPAPTNMGPRFPDDLRKANVEGEVLAQFVVGTDGRADMTTFKVLKSTHEQFTESVQRSLPQMMFYPALVGERPVKQVVQMPFQFSLAK